ncbi:tRNA wybutosine-synthesizing protein 2 homolog [Osmerus mordax]|uniref:tRNA wybutosine-synthesizing protein 2 homolog n=1 Tax=Osmerus mordax TaxID=8014 RepID=UPI00350FC233
MNGVPSLRVLPSHAQQLRKYLQACGSLDLRYTVQKLSDGTVAIPVLPSCLPQLDLHSLQHRVTSESPCEIIRIPVPKLSKRERGRSSSETLVKILQELLNSHGEGPELWPAVAHGLGAERLAQMGRISRDGFRTPVVTMLLGEDHWVTHVDNRIRYQFDVTKCMFSSGNITEKIRIASFDCHGEIVVDLYAGIGYFTLPYLVHAGASHVHACEWNPDAVEALERNLQLNGMSHLCTIHHGDNRQLPLCDLADRVNLGLIPSSQDSWPVACRLLKRKTGGVLHIHHNVTSPPHKTGCESSFIATVERAPKTRDKKVWQAWADETAIQISTLLQDITVEPWRTSVQHIEHVKSYAPHVHHIVLDLECRPLQFKQTALDVDSMFG